MNVAFTPAARKQLGALPKADARRIEEALRLVAESYPQRLGFVTEIVGAQGVWRLRKGNYRAVFRLTGTAMTVTSVGHRKEIYE